METSSASASVPVGWLTCIILVILKVTGTIGMSWFWVISSIIWAPIISFILILSVVGVIALIASALGG